MGKECELVDIVNLDDEVIGTALRSDVDNGNLRVRASRVIVLNKQGGIWVQRRAASKSIHPNMLEAGIGETLLSGESYEHGAKRGFLEEMLNIPRITAYSTIYGINVEQPFVVPVTFADRYTTRNYMVYVLYYDEEFHGPISIEKKETASGRFVSREKLKTAVKNNKDQFTPVGLLMANCGLFVSKYGSSGLNGEEIDKILRG